MKKQILFVVAMMLMSLVMTAQAQQTNGVEGWIKGRTNYYTKHLDLTEEQSKQVYGFLSESTKNAAEIKEILKGEEQKKALWQNQKELERKMKNILTDEQKQKLKELEQREKEENRKKKAEK